MDLIYTAPGGEELGVLPAPSLDLAFGSDENDFELTIKRERHCMGNGSLFYVEHTEYGGIVDGISIDTAAETVTYKGRSWHGVLAKKVIVPSAKSRLPEGYTELTHITANGKQYLDMEFAPNQDTRVVLKASFQVASSSKFLFGARTATKQNGFAMNTTGSAYRLHYGSDYFTFGTDLAFTEPFVIDLNKNVGTIGDQTHTFAEETFQSPCNMVLFGVNNNGSVGTFCSGSAWACQVYDNGELIRDYIPCINDSNEVGMYDAVRKKFSGSKGTESFIAGSVVRLPNGYKRLTHIESTGTQYIDSGFKPNQDTRVVMDFRLNSDTSEQTPLHARRAAGEDTYGLFLMGTAWTVDYGTIRTSFPVSFSATERLLLDFNKSVVTLNGSVLRLESQTFSAPVNLAIFARNTNGTINNYAIGQIYSCQIYDNDVLVRDYVPCENPDGIVGLYDAVNGVFYGNSGSGTFIPGDVVAVSDGNSGNSGGDANDCLRSLINRVGLSEFFHVPDELCGVTIKNHSFTPYADAYTEICRMLASAGLRLSLSMDDARLTAKAVRRYDYSVDQEFESDLIDYRMNKMYLKPNHLVCLGAGKDADRIVVHLYADANGNVSEIQTYTGVLEYTEVYDRPGELTAENEVDEETGEEIDNVAAEREEERKSLIAAGTAHLKQLLKTDSIDVDFGSDDDVYYIGDIVGAYESDTGESVKAAVSKKIVKIENGRVTVSYEVEDPVPSEEEE